MAVQLVILTNNGHKGYVMTASQTRLIAAIKCYCDCVTQPIDWSTIGTGGYYGFTELMTCYTEDQHEMGAVGKEELIKLLYTGVFHQMPAGEPLDAVDECEQHIATSHLAETRNPRKWSFDTIQLEVIECYEQYLANETDKKMDGGQYDFVADAPDGWQHL